MSTVPRTRPQGLRLAPALTTVTLALGLAALPDPARADRRVFPYTYGYMTLPKGGFEVEHYLDATVQRRDDPVTPDPERRLGVDWRHQVELEYGITDHWDFGFYSVFEQKQFGDFSFRGVKLRTRYRFGEEGRWFIDPALYAEVVAYSDEVKLEQIIILAKRFHRFELALNLKFEQGWSLKGPEREFELEFVPSLGFAWHITNWIALGVEYLFKVAVEEGEVAHAHFLGPTLSIGTRRFYWTLGFQPELAYQDGRRFKFQARSLFGILF